MKDVIFNYYDADIKKSNALGYVSLDYMLNAIKSPKKDIKHIFEQIRQCEISGNLKLKAELKTKLYSFTPCVKIVKGTNRSYKSIIEFTGLLMLDFDHLEEDYAVEFKNALFEENKFIISAWLSASRHGVRAIVKIPKCFNVDEFKHYFAGIESYFNQCNGFDKAPKNCILPLFISYDEDILIRENASTWSKKIIPVEAPQIRQYIITDKTPFIEKIVIHELDKISDAGHMILRATSYLLGGYVGAGHIDKETAISIINNKIDQHGYLKQKASTYKKTAKTMIEKGINNPVYLKENEK